MKEENQELGGLFPATLTMFDEKGELDIESMCTHINYLIDHGVDGLICLGTTGEFIALSYDERIRLMKVFLEEARNRVPVYCMTGFFDTRRTIKLSMAAEELGASGLMVILPYYQRPAKKSVLEHYRILRRHTDLPIMAYNNFLFSACTPLNPWEIVMLANEGVINAVKTNTGETMVIHNIKSLLPSDSSFKVFHGVYVTAYEAIVCGVDGWISGILNSMPGECRQLWDMINKKRDYQGALKYYREKFVPIVQLLAYNKKNGEPEFGPFFREMLRLRGQAYGYPMKPYTPLTEDMKERLKSVMNSAGLL